jgi:hypothetical protein
MVKTSSNLWNYPFPSFYIMRQPRKQTKGKSKDKLPPPVAQKPPNTKLMLRVPPLAQAAPPTKSPRTATPELAPEAGPLQPDEDIQIDSDIHRDIPEVSYFPSPRQQIIDQFWEESEDGDHNVTNLPNEATSHRENDPGLPLAGASRKRKASTHSLERSSSGNPDVSNDENSDSADGPDLSIQPAKSKKARKTPRETIEIDGTDEEFDSNLKAVTKGQQGRKPSTGKKERMRRNRATGSDLNGDSDDEEGSYKNST